ncbi:uncharacterized protein [Nicotiana sylvestris]|uniref:uncharacterized protein n=1 Tax=Nicotiana sylvestris TaxID=4096 RepID=UPI00388C4B91
MDPLKYIFQKPMPTGKLAKWQILLSEFDIIYVTQKAAKRQTLVDLLAENPVGGEYESLKTYFPDEKVSFIGEEIVGAYDGWRMFFDEAANFKGVVPESIIIDNAANLNSDIIKAMCESFKIKKNNSTAYRPQMNGAMEASNKNIKKMLRKMVENNKQWYEKLPFALLGYRTTVRTSTGATPYLLVYGTKVVIPAEIEIPSLRIIQEDKLSDVEWIKSHYEQLALIDGKRMNAVCHGQLYHNIMYRAFNKRVKPRQFTPGQMVLSESSCINMNPKENFHLIGKGPSWFTGY